MKYTSGGDNLAPLLTTAVEGGNPPDIAAIGQPGLMADFAKQNAIKPMDDLREQDRRTPSERTSRTRGRSTARSTALMYKGANKSTIWYNVADFEEAGVEPPGDLGRVRQRPRHAQGRRHHALLGRCRRRLADLGHLRERLHPQRGPGEVRPAREARDPVDRPVGQGRADDHEGHRRQVGLHGRRHRRRAADGDAGLGRQGVLGRTRTPRWSSSATSHRASTETTLEPETGYNVFTSRRSRARSRRSWAVVTSSSSSRTARRRTRSSST